MKPVALPERNEMRAAVEEMRRNIQEIIDYSKLMAKVRKAHFDSLMEAGFTEDQAIKLCEKVMP